MKRFDLIIIGAGPIGMATAIEAQQKGLNYLVLEKGCLVNSLYKYPTNMTFFSSSENLEIGAVPFLSNNVRPTRPEALEYYRRVQTSHQLQIHLFEEVTSLEKVDHQFEVVTTKDAYTAASVVIATGFFDFANLLQIEGEQLPKVIHYYDDPHFYAFSNVVVVGAANSAIDAALQTYRKGANVTLIMREGAISDRVKYWVKPDIENRIKEGAIAVHYESELLEITPKSVKFKNQVGEVVEIDNDFVLAMTGYHPNYAFLEAAGVQLTDQIPFYDPQTNETNVEGLYLAGVICGGKITNEWFIENSIIHAERIVGDILNKRSEVF